MISTLELFHHKFLKVDEKANEPDDSLILLTLFKFFSENSSMDGSYEYNLQSFHLRHVHAGLQEMCCENILPVYAEKIN